MSQYVVNCLFSKQTETLDNLSCEGVDFCQRLCFKRDCLKASRGLSFRRPRSCRASGRRVWKAAEKRDERVQCREQLVHSARTRRYSAGLTSVWATDAAPCTDADAYSPHQTSLYRRRENVSRHIGWSTASRYTRAESPIHTWVSPHLPISPPNEYHPPGFIHVLYLYCTTKTLLFVLFFNELLPNTRVLSCALLSYRRGVVGQIKWSYCPVETHSDS